MVTVFDMDGVLYRMDEPIAGAAEAVARLHARGEKVFYLTNNSTKTRAEYVTKLAQFGIAAAPEEIMTSAYACAQLLQERGATGKNVYVIGEAGLREELRNVGIQVIAYDDAAPIDYVVVGWDRAFTYQKMTEAHRAIGRGAVFIATNRDATYPDAGGRTLPGGGAIVASIVTCTGVEPMTIGKPQPYTLELILRQANVSPEECLVIGDRLDTDIAIGKHVGTRTALVLTGVSTREDVANAPLEQRPDRLLTDLFELV